MTSVTARPGPDREPAGPPGVTDGTDFCRPAEAPGRPVGRIAEDRCSVRALARGDSGIATASPAQRWLLIEQAGPWGVEALTQSRFDAAVAPRLAHRVRVENVRVLLVRRPGDRPADAQRRWAYVDGRPGREGLWWSARTSDAELVDAPGDGAVGEPPEGPTYLGCAHGGAHAPRAPRGRPRAPGPPP